LLKPDDPDVQALAIDPGRNRNPITIEAEAADLERQQDSGQENWASG
jgi:hypothetical protein